jgi:pyridoxal phosphate enzyme (YggS family)
MIKQNVQNLLGEIPQTNKYGEKVTLVAAVKMQTPEAINEAIEAGICHIGDNHVQEFKDKYDLISGNPTRHFIGHLQTNKVKYLIGKVDLYHSVDRLQLAEELSKRSANAGVISHILLQVNIGNEETKGGFELSQVQDAYATISSLPALKIDGLMAMLPFIDDDDELKRLAMSMRQKYDQMKNAGADFKYLSMGMSGDWKLCVECGSNMIRIGTTIFGKRNYQ